MSEIANGNPLDKNRSGKTNVKKTKYPMNYHIYGTYRFGEYGLGFIYDGIAGEKTRFQHGCEVNSYTLQAPLLTPINMNKTYIQVPRMAILPNTWEKIFTNPSIGEDINATIYGTSIEGAQVNNILSEVKDLLESKLTLLLQTIADEETSLATVYSKIEDTIHALMLGELYFSKGSLINAMGAKISHLWKSTRDYDSIFDMIMKMMKIAGAIMVTNYRNNKSYIIVLDTSKEFTAFRNITKWTLNQWLEELRDGETFKINKIIDKAETEYSAGGLKDAIYDDVYALQSIVENATLATYNKPLDIAFVEAYHLGCAEFFTNDKVDYVYNGELYRQYIGNLVQEFLNEQGEALEDYMYELNGIKYQPDWLSQIYISYALKEVTSTYGRTIAFAIFKYNRSLKYKDYFTGSRTRPIAIGDTNIDVIAGDHVEVIDVVKNIQKQRFLNVVNKIPRDLKGYTKGIMGKDVAPDWHNPLFLMRTSEVIYGQETENTGEAQVTQAQSRTSVLKNTGKNIQVRFDLDRNSIIVGFIDFDIPRAYSKGVRREFMHVDRFDMFNPYLQYTGDQPVYGEELNIRQSNGFGYQGAYMEMKQKYSEAFGGFIDVLKGWTFLDSYIENQIEGTVEEDTQVIGPDFIRSKPSELDRFYISLSGHSMSTYFHFIIDNEIHIEAVKPMAYNPQILG